jgi:hypothetical protein
MSTASTWGVRIAVALAVAGLAGYFGYETYRLYDFPAGYRNRPSIGLYRPGEDEFSLANERIHAHEGTEAFGNSPPAIELAGEFAQTFKEARKGLFTAAFPIDLLDSSNGRFLTWCELHDQECAFIVHVPGLRHFEHSMLEKVDARRLLAQTAWMTAQKTLAAHRIGTPGMELAVGLRGASQYGPILLGYVAEPGGPEAGLVKYLDDSAKTHFLWTFFAPVAGSRPRPR